MHATSLRYESTGFYASSASSLIVVPVNAFDTGQPFFVFSSISRNFFLSIVLTFALVFSKISEMANPSVALPRVTSADVSTFSDGLPCLLYTSDAADEEDSVDLGGRRIIKKKKK